MIRFCRRRCRCSVIPSSNNASVVATFPGVVVDSVYYRKLKREKRFSTS